MVFCLYFEDGLSPPENHSVSVSLLRSPIKDSERSSMSGISWQDSRPFHAQRKPHNSSSWLDLTPNFRQEIRQSYCRNDNVKYDLGERPPLFYQYMTLWQIFFVYLIDYSTRKSPKIVLKCRFCWMLVYPYSNIRGHNIIQIWTHLYQIAFWPVPNPFLIIQAMKNLAGFL